MSQTQSMTQLPFPGTDAEVTLRVRAEIRCEWPMERALYVIVFPYYHLSWIAFRYEWQKCWGNSYDNSQHIFFLWS
ncbi:MAG: hypothetical protein QOD75_4047 [Blastocatellia bacterium]|nr:hypothetical protein [Blastocatellia bacterium]